MWPKCRDCITVSRILLLSVVLEAADEGRVFNAATGVAEPRDGPIVAEACELVLHRLREHGAVDVRVLGGLVGKYCVKVAGVKGVDLWVKYIWLAMLS
jgi:hypothetical protein